MSTLLSDILSTIIAENGAGITNENQNKMYILSYVHLGLLILYIFFVFLIPSKSDVTQMHLEIQKWNKFYHKFKRY